MRALIARLRSDPGLALACAAIIAALIVYAPTLGYGLVNHDDPWLVRENWIVQDASWTSVHRILFDLDVQTRGTLGAEYLPVRDLSVMLDFAVWGEWFGGFHLVNLALYLASIGLWFAALSSFGVDRRVAGIAVLLWAVHPSHAESVAWISERKGVLAMMFAGVVGLGYARFRRGAGWGWLALAAVCSVLAVWSKGLAAFSIAALAGLEWALPGRQSVRRALVGLVVLAIVTGLAFIPILRVAVDMQVVAEASGNRFTGAVGLMGFYARLAAMTMPNAISYPYATDGPSTFDLIIGVLALAAAVAALFARDRTLRVASIIWLAGWFPVSRLILPVKAIVVADRYLLFPSLGIALALAVGLAMIPKRRSAIALGAVLVIASLLRTLDAQSNWRDKLALWDRAVASNPRDMNAWSSYVEALASTGQRDAALAAGERGLAIEAAPRLQQQMALMILPSDPVRGRQLLQAAADGGWPQAMSNLATILVQEARVDEALVYARRATEMLPRYAHGFRTLGKVALAAHEPVDALAAFERAVALEPNCVNKTNVGVALVAVGKPDEAHARLSGCPDTLPR